MKTKRIAQTAFSRKHVAIALLLCAASSIVAGTVLGFCRTEAPTKSSHPAGAGLTFADRVAYQRAIDEVYWRHRIWPHSRGERPDPKPSLDAVMSQAQLEKKVTDYLRKSEALADYWQRPLTTEQLQAEVDRMGSHTKQPEVLEELFEALGNDPFVILECLAKPILAERTLAALTSFTKPSEAPPNGAEQRMTNAVATLSISSTTALFPPPYLNSGGRYNPMTDIWTLTNTTDAPSERGSHTAVWTGSEMIIWGGWPNLNTGAKYIPSTDSWTEISTANAPTGRFSHTAVWTGSEMIVWGGVNGGGNLNTGGRYNPGTDTWTATSTTNAPSARAAHTAVWTGKEMIVWGGSDGSTYHDTGGKYDPVADNWVATTILSAPSARDGHTVVWTGTEMIIWGGYDGFGYLNTGGRYNPSTESWATTSTSNAPTARSIHTAVWSDSEMIVWGGWSGTNTLFTGARYNPTTDSWTITSTANAPSARLGHTAVWTDSEMIIWGGSLFGSPSYTASGGRYHPSTDSWTATGVINVPEARAGHTAVWTDSEMIIWGGSGPTPTPTATPTITPTATPTVTATPTPTASSMPCHVTSSACGTVITGTAPTDFIVNVSDPVDPATVQPADFTVNGISADASALINGNTTIVFHFNTTPVTQGLNTMHIPACAFNCGNGCVQEFTCTFTYEASTPTPTPTATPTATFTATATVTPTATATPTASLPPSPTSTPTSTPTLTPRPSPTPRPALTPRPRPTPPPRP